jgi:heme-degrading monooxygenase HmoA
MVVVLFRSRLTAAASEDYQRTDAAMAAIAASMPGFIDAKSFVADDGERLTVVWWKDAETLRAWREHPDHRAAQAAGRARWYEYYRMEVADVVRQSVYDRAPRHTDPRGRDH